MRRRRPEEILQRSVVDLLTKCGVPGLVWFHVPNGGKRGLAEAARFKRMGVRPGVSDLILFHRGCLYALELKAGKGKPTDLQEQFMEDVRKAGGRAVWAAGMDEAMYTLQFWGLLRPIEGLSKVAA
jgi:hypothetical protein